MTVRVLGTQAAPERARRAGERVAAHIFRAAGVTLSWVECAAEKVANPCDVDPEPTELWLEMLDHPLTEIDADSIGFSVAYRGTGAAGYAAVLYPEVSRLARTMQQPVADLLGVAIAHEIGHLLLGTKLHSTEGIMSPQIRAEQLGLAGRGQLLFTPDQAQRIRTEVARRNGPLR
jgi:hypothetical protein